MGASGRGGGEEREGKRGNGERVVHNAGHVENVYWHVLFHAFSELVHKFECVWLGEVLC